MTMHCFTCGGEVGDFTDYPFKYVYMDLAFCSQECIDEMERPILKWKRCVICWDDDWLPITRTDGKDGMECQNCYWNEEKWFPVMIVKTVIIAVIYSPSTLNIVNNINGIGDVGSRANIVKCGENIMSIQTGVRIWATMTYVWTRRFSMKTVTICIEIEEDEFKHMKDLYTRIKNCNHADTRTFKQWVADIAVWGSKIRP